MSESATFQTAGQAYSATLVEVSLAVGCTRDEAALIVARLAHKGYMLWTDAEIEQAINERMPDAVPIEGHCQCCDYAGMD